MNEIPECFYRVSVKALILNEAKDKFLICEEDSGKWELPGGGLDWGEIPQQGIPREISEEMGLRVLEVAEHPAYFLTGQMSKGDWAVNVLYETKVEHLNFTPSDECVNIRFVNKEDVQGMEVFPTIQKLAEMFNPEMHLR